ncbi:hypothetical protein ACFXOM_12900 [Streptomyces sp. NPDC059169]
MAIDPSEYDKAMPIALVEALRDEDAQGVPSQAVDEYARRISEAPDMLPF